LFTQNGITNKPFDCMCFHIPWLSQCQREGVRTKLIVIPLEAKNHHVENKIKNYQYVFLLLKNRKNITI